MAANDKRFTYNTPEAAPEAGTNPPSRWGTAPIFSVRDLRAAAPDDLKDSSDEELMIDFANTLGKDPYELATRMGMRTGAKSGDISSGLSSGVDQLQGLGYSALAGAADLVGLDSGRDYLNKQAEQQQLEGYFAGKPERERVEDIGGFGDAIDWAQYQLGKQIPIMGGLIGAQFVPGLGQAASATGLTRLATLAPRGLGGGGFGSATGLAAQKAAVQQGAALGKSTLVGSALGFGDLYQASGEDGEYDPFTALALALPYGAAEAVVPALVGRAIRAPQQFAGNLASRVGKAAGVSALTEAGTEAFQTSLTRGIDSTASPEDAASEYLNAIVAGGVVGGSFGSIGGIKSPAKPKAKVEQNELNETDLAPAADVPVEQEAPTAAEQPAAKVTVPKSATKRSSKKAIIQEQVQDDSQVEVAEPTVATAYDSVFNDPNNQTIADLQQVAKTSIPTGQVKVLTTQIQRLEQEIAEAQRPIAEKEGPISGKRTAAEVKRAQKVIDKKFDAEQKARQDKVDSLRNTLSKYINATQAAALLKTAAEGLRKVNVVDGEPVISEQLNEVELQAIQRVDPDLYTKLQEQAQVEQVAEPALQQETDLTASNVTADVTPAVMEQEQLESVEAPEPVVSAKPTAADTTKNSVVAKELEDLDIAELFDQDDYNDIISEVEAINSGRGALEAEVVSEPNRLRGKVTLPQGVIAGIVTMLRNPRNIEFVTPRAYKKGVVAVDEQLTAEYGERMAAIREAIRDISAAYSKILDAGNKLKQPKEIRGYRASIADFRKSLDDLLSSGLLGKDRRESMANMQAIIAGIKTKNEQKYASIGKARNQKAIKEGADLFNKNKLNNVLEYAKTLDTMSSNMFSSLVNGSLTYNSFATRVNNQPTRTSNKQLAGGEVQPLVKEYRGDQLGKIVSGVGKAKTVIAEGVPKPDKLDKGTKWEPTRGEFNNKGGLIAVVAKAAGTSGIGVASPYSKLLSRAIRRALENATTKSGTSVTPAVVFFEPGTDTARYDPNEGQFGTVYLSQTASQEVVLHESLHAALQWLVYSDSEVVAPYVADLSKSLDELFAFVDDVGIDSLELSDSYKKEANRVVSILRSLRDSGNEKDAVLELISYGTTLRSFQSLLKGIKAEPNDATIKTWLQRLDDVFKNIMAMLRDLLGMPNTLASRVLENTVMLLDSSSAEFAPETFAGKRLDHALEDASYRNSDQAAMKADGTYVKDKLVSASLDAKKDSLLSTRFLFRMVKWDKFFGKELDDGTIEPGVFQEKMGRIANSVRANMPGLTRTITLFNSVFSVASKSVRAAFEQFKQDRGAGFLFVDHFISFMEREMSPEQLQATINYLDTGNSARLDQFKEAETIKEWADQSKELLVEYAQSLPETDRKFFIRYSYTEKKFVLAGNFSDLLFRVSDDKAISSHTLGLTNIRNQIKASTEGVDEATFEGFAQDLMNLDENGEPSLDGEFYKLSISAANAGGSDYVMFVSKDLYESLNGDLSDRLNLGTGEFAYPVDTSAAFKYVGFKDKQHRFTMQKSFKDAMNKTRAQEFILAMRNTFGGLGNYVASKNLIRNIANSDVVYNSVDDINRELGLTDPANMYTDKHLSHANDVISPRFLGKANWVSRSKGMFVRVPGDSESDTARWGELAGKIIPGEVWVAMNDMADRTPMFGATYNEALQAWKKSKTVWNFGTQITNVLSNVVLMMFHGIPLRTTLDAANLLIRYEFSPSSMTADERLLVSTFMKSGAMIGNFANTEIKRTYANLLTKSMKPGAEVSLVDKVGTMLNLESKLAKEAAKYAGKGANAAVRMDEYMTMAYNMGDNVFRFAAFMTRAGDIMRNSGEKSPSKETVYKAGLYAKNAFIDYDIDAKGIKMARQSLLPFVSYSYGIMPVLARIVATKPWLIANTMATMMLLDAAMAALADDDDDETRKLGPKNMEDRVFVYGPRFHIRLPFFGDEDNPVYLRWGDYVPFASSIKGGMPNNFASIESWPQALSPSNPLLTLGTALFGYDLYTGKSIYDRGNVGLDSVSAVAKEVYDIIVPSWASSTSIKAAREVMDEKVGPTGVEPSAAMLMFGRIIGLKLMDYNIGEEAYFRSLRASDNTRNFKAAIRKAQRDELAKGYPDYEALDARIMELYEGMREGYNEIYKIDEDEVD